MSEPTSNFERIQVYGWMVVLKNEETGCWQTEPCDEYSNLPAHHEWVEQAKDQAEHLRKRGIQARVAALLAEPTDTAEDFEASRIKYDQ